MKRKILIYSLHLGAGGTEKRLIDLLNNLDYSKYEVDPVL